MRRGRDQDCVGGQESKGTQGQLSKIDKTGVDLKVAERNHRLRENIYKQYS